MIKIQKLILIYHINATITKRLQKRRINKKVNKQNIVFIQIKSMRKLNFKTTGNEWTTSFSHKNKYFFLYIKHPTKIRAAYSSSSLWRAPWVLRAASVSGGRWGGGCSGRTGTRFPGRLSLSSVYLCVNSNLKGVCVAFNFKVKKELSSWKQGKQFFYFRLDKI